MTPAYQNLRIRHAQGFSMLSAVFILVVLAVLGAAMVTLSSSQHKNSALDVLGSRVYQAARAGIEWGKFRTLISPGTCAPGPSSFVAPDDVLNGFTVSVACNATIANGITVFVVTSTACNVPAGGNCPGNANAPDYVERVLQATIQQ